MLLVICGFGASLVAVCLLIANAGGCLTAPQVQQAWQQAEISNDITGKGTEEIQFPYSITGTDLVLERFACYDGPYLEDGTDREVVEVTGAVLRNTGKKGIVSVKLVVLGADRKLVFLAETIPPGQAVLVLDQNKSRYKQDMYYDCYAEKILEEEKWWMHPLPETEPVGMGSLRVTNTTDSTMENVWLYYKTYQSDPGIYIGGFTYKVGIRRLEPGQTLLINPPHYANGYSQIVRIMTQ